MKFDIIKQDKNRIHVKVSLNPYTKGNREACTANVVRKHLESLAILTSDVIQGGIIDNKFDTSRQLTYVLAVRESGLTGHAITNKLLDRMTTTKVILQKEDPATDVPKKSKRNRRSKLSSRNE